MAVFNKFQSFVQQLGLEGHELETDVLKVALTNSAPVATNTILANITQISAGNGYTTGGNTATNNTYTNSSGTSTLDADNVVFTASGGSMGPFRYAVLYNDTSASDLLIGWFDYGSNVTLADTETFTVAWDAAGILTIV